MHEPRIVVYKNLESGGRKVQLLEDGDYYRRTESG